MHCRRGFTAMFDVVRSSIRARRPTGSTNARAPNGYATKRRRITRLVPTTAAVLRDAGGESEIDTEEDMLNPFKISDADITEVYGLKVHGDDNPTFWAQAMRSDEANQWRDAARAEMQNFERHGVYVKTVSDDQLPT
eukprot:5138488-Pleurochrysis_carterae.AAC.1